MKPGESIFAVLDRFHEAALRDIAVGEGDDVVFVPKGGMDPWCDRVWVPGLPAWG